MRESALEHLRSPGPPGGAPLVLHPFRGGGGQVEEGVLTAPDGRWWWIAGGIPRLLPAEMYRNAELEERYRTDIAALYLQPPARGPRAGRLWRVQAKTIDRFGAEWLRFRDWGFHPEPPDGDALEYRGGLWANTQSAFASKTFLGGRVRGALCLDAGCGNGRFTAAALAEGAREVVAVDIGWGVEAAHERFKNDPRVHVVQASLFDLPLAGIEAAFSIGVLMHTGDAAKAFARIAAAVAPGGFFAVRVYHRGNWVYEALDRTIRAATTRLGKRGQARFARAMSRVGRRIDRCEARRPGTRAKWYAVLRHWPSQHHNLDWWSAPVASHHTAAQVERWAHAAGLSTLKIDPRPWRSRHGFWAWPEAVTALFQRPASVEIKTPADALVLAEQCA